MNKTQIKIAIESKLDKKLKDITFAYEQMQQSMEQEYIQQQVGNLLSSFNYSLSLLKESHVFRTFMSNSEELQKAIEQDKYLNCLSSHYKDNFFQVGKQIIDGTFDFDVYLKVNTYNGREVDINLYNEYKRVSRATEHEYSNLLAYLKVTTAQKFMEHMDSIGFKLEISTEVAKQQLPAPKFNMQLLK